MNKNEIKKLHSDLLTAWNTKDATKMASLFTDNGVCIGFDGSQYNGRKEIEANIAKIFIHHQTSEYVWQVRDVLFPNNDTAVLQAVAGMIPPGQRNINPAVNAIQTITAIKQNEEWRIALFQNTPAQFHGRPELAEALTRELTELIGK